MADEGPRPTQDDVVRWLDVMHERISALQDRVDAGDEVTDAEVAEMLCDVFADLAHVLGTDRVQALVDRAVAGEEVTDAEARQAFLEAFARLDTNR